MLVKNCMTTNPVTITPEMPVAEALSFMRQHNVRRLPILNKKRKLVGIISEKDLLYASPSPATSLSVYEVGYLLSKLKVEEIMTKNVVTVAPDAPLEEAARIMADSKIGGLPVVDGDRLVGIITETDVFKTILEMMGARQTGVRLTLHLIDEPGALSRIAGSIAALGGDIIALGTFHQPDGGGALMVKVRGVARGDLINAMTAINVQVVDAREN
ncbi:MAG TPA: CBS and ACT domain-containing protein [Anaerolineae bacterium]|nr:CBS and ACT domain-containing protein [Anaerolineae bacterium]HQI83303.1 CBS and ACT domain-containing protein [Anaerolineae bacterium]